MLNSDDTVQCDSTDWIDCVDRGGLTFVSGLTFEVFLAMELEIRRHLQGCKPVNFISDIAPAVKSNEDVLFFWSMLSSSGMRIKQNFVSNGVMANSSWLFILKCLDRRKVQGCSKEIHTED